ncbi:TetR/AcrR family transcriptional regulator [Chitinophaga pendula]|uniref:TetR/AcrR family transcriptional regulator n=1 Tax=Chitinophaga TaxID=79328 RepID=UPI000BAF52EB|nr:MULTISPECIES: TetR/AcrR family transcriptional regulator [Chitinophaga]ASZ12639.1 TetR family transcriptional regulator [Chitinophaga sp. MD30]UCJ09751.1 TetR/AcrR family transcriptional regulator [Chitinophaga pendula]
MTKAEQTKQLIIEKTVSLFNTKGIAATAMSDIMDATGLAKGSLYLHFENKEELSYSVVDYSLQLLSEKLFFIVNKSKTPKAKLLAHIQFFSDPLHPPVTGGCPMMNFGMEADDTNQVIKEKIRSFMQNGIDAIAETIREGIRIGQFKQDWNAKEFAVKMFALLEGGIMMSRIIGNNEASKTIVGILKKEIDAQTI